ncbi:hypothetical protein ACQBAU_05160 [Propionibacteriaceae bacterium Y2011]
MLEFVDRFADPRHLADPALRCAAIWIGTVPSEAALVDHLSPDDPAAGQFARDAGDAYDPDFLASEVTEPRPIKVVLAEIADRHGLTEAQLDDLVHRCETHGVTAANTTVVLGQHRFDGDADVAFHDLVLVGNVEYRGAGRTSGGSTVRAPVRRDHDSADAGRPPRVRARRRLRPGARDGVDPRRVLRIQAA